MTQIPARTSRIVTAPELVVGVVMAVRGYSQEVGDRLFVGPRPDFRYDVDVLTPEGRRPMRDLRRAFAHLFPSTPWCYMHPPEEYVYGFRIGREYHFQFLDFIPWTGPCDTNGGAA